MTMTSTTRPVVAPDPHFSSLARVVLLALVLGISAMGTDMYLPAFPAIRQAFGASSHSVQLSLSVFLYGSALGQLVYGPLSDRYGRRPVLLWGLLAFALASLGCALATDISSFIGCRAVQGAAAAGGPVLVRALLSDRMAREQAAQMLALLTGLMAFLAMLTPIAGGWLVQYGTWRWIFYAITGIGVVLLGACAMLTGETLPPERRQSRLGVSNIARGYLEILGNRGFWCYVLPPALMFAGVFAYVATNSFLLIDQLGMAERRHGMTYSIAAGAFVLGSLTTRRLVRRTGTDRAIAIGLVLGSGAALAAVSASTALPLSITLVVLPGVATFFCTALVVPVASATAVSLFPARAGSASAVAGCTQIATAGGATMLAAALVSDSILPLHLFTLGCFATASCVWLAGAGVRRGLHSI